MKGRYARQTGLSGFGEKSVEVLKNTKMVVVGAGGVGSALLPILAGAGVGKILIADGDRVSISNLHRQTLYTEKQVGQSKARLAAERLSSINSEVEISVFEKFLNSREDVLEILKGADMCIDASDNFKTRILVSEVCAEAGVREILSSAGGYLSQLFMLGGKATFASFVGDESAKSEGSMGLPIFPAAAHLSGVMGAGAALRVALGAQKFEEGFFQCYDFESGRLFSCRL